MLFALLYEGRDAVRAEIAVDCEHIGGERLYLFAVDIRFAEIRLGIASRRRADIVALAVCNYEHIPALSIVYSIVEGAQPLVAVLLVVSDLHLDGGNYIAHFVDYVHVEFDQPLSNAFERGDTFAKLFGKIGKIGIKTDAGGVLQFYDSVNEFIYHDDIFSLNVLFKVFRHRI